jgi:hypothetical protein
MPLRVATVIEESRWEDPSFVAQRHSETILRSRLADYQKELVGKLAQEVPEEFSTPYEIDMPLADFRAGHELVDDAAEPLAYVMILDTGEIHGANGRRYPLDMIAHRNRFQVTTRAHAWVLAGRLYLGGAESNWEGIDRVIINLVPSPSDTLEDDDELIFGHRARSLYVAYLALQMAKRAPDEVLRSVQSFADDVTEREVTLLAELMDRHPSDDAVRDTTSRAGGFPLG